MVEAGIVTPKQAVIPRLRDGEGFIISPHFQRKKKKEPNGSFSFWWRRRVTTQYRSLCYMAVLAIPTLKSQIASIFKRGFYKKQALPWRAGHILKFMLFAPRQYCIIVSGTVGNRETKVDKLGLRITKLYIVQLQRHKHGKNANALVAVNECMII